jgi:hypothetical protein
LTFVQGESSGHGGSSGLGFHLSKFQNFLLSSCCLSSCRSKHT